MRLRRARTQSPPPTVYVGDHTHKLSRIPALAHDEDERPRREDQDYAKHLFTDPPVPLPRFLTGAKKAKRGASGRRARATRGRAARRRARSATRP